MLVKANNNFKDLRNLVLGLEKKDFRALQAGKEVEITKSLYDKFKKYFLSVEPKKKVEKINGD